MHVFLLLYMNIYISELTFCLILNHNFNYLECMRDKNLYLINQKIEFDVDEDETHNIIIT